MFILTPQHKDGHQFIHYKTGRTKLHYKNIVKHASLVCSSWSLYLGTWAVSSCEAFLCVFKSFYIQSIWCVWLCICVFVFVYFLQLVLIRVKAQLWDIKARGHTPRISLTFVHPEYLTWMFLLKKNIWNHSLTNEMHFLTMQDKDVQLRDLYYLPPNVDPVLLCHLVSITRKPLSSFLGNYPPLSRDLCLKVSLNAISFFKLIFVHTVNPLCQHCRCNQWFIDWHN